MIDFNVFPGCKHHILTMSYDDSKESDRKLVDIFNKYGIKGTFHIVSGWLDKPGFITSGEVKDLYKGHEVSVHTAHHYSLTDLSKQGIIKEVMDCVAHLESLCGYPVRGIALPGGDRNLMVDDVLRSLGMCYSRTGNFTGTYLLPEDFILWNPSCHHTDAHTMLDKFISSQSRHDLNQFFYVMGHSYEFDRDNNWDLIEEFCKRTSNLEDTWYATNIEIYDYRMAQHRLQYTQDFKYIYNPSAMDVWVNVYGEPICIGGGMSVSL